MSETPPDGREPNLTLARSMEELRLKQDAHAATWGLGQTDRWDADLDAGTIEFSGRNEILVKASLQVIGTYDLTDQTWLWGWDHPSVSAALGKGAQLCRDFGRRYGLAPYTERKVQCSEDDAWQFTAVALYLSGAAGAYRGPSGSTLVFMTFDDVTLEGET